MADTSLLFSSVTVLAEALRRRQVSSVELTEAYLTRLAQLGPSLGALAHLTRAQAMVQAQEADKLLDQEARGGRPRGVLTGIPWGAKDLLATVDVPTEWGSPAHAGQIFDYDATVVQRLQGAGAVLVGKLSMIELAGAGASGY